MVMSQHILLSFVNNGLLLQFGKNQRDNTTITLPIAYKNDQFKYLFALEYGNNNVTWEEATGNYSPNRNPRTSTTITTGTRVGDWLTLGI